MKKKRLSKPSKPTEPVAPDPVFKDQVVRVKGYLDDTNLETLVKELVNVNEMTCVSELLANLAQFRLSHEEDFYASSCDGVHVVTQKDVPNPHYKKQHQAWLKKHAEWERDMVRYNEKLQEWEAQQEEQRLLKAEAVRQSELALLKRLKAKYEPGTLNQLRRSNGIEELD